MPITLTFTPDTILPSCCNFLNALLTAASTLASESSFEVEDVELGVADEVDEVMLVEDGFVEVGFFWVEHEKRNMYGTRDATVKMILLAVIGNSFAYKNETDSNDLNE